MEALQSVPERPPVNPQLVPEVHAKSICSVDLNAREDSNKQCRNNIEALHLDEVLQIILRRWIAP